MKETTSRLLAHSKEFFLAGGRELEQNTAMAYMQAVLKFHDAIEYCIRAVIEEYNVSHDRKMDFLSLMKCIDQSIADKRLPLSSQMDFLNATRVKVKHHASVPSLEDVQRCHLYTGDFIGQVAKEYLNTEFLAISRLLLVENGNVRKCLELAEEKAKERDYLEALIQIKKAFYTARPSDHTFVSKEPSFTSFFITSGFSNLTSGFRDLSELRKPIAKIVDKINELEENIALLMMGIDVSKLRRFEELTPHFSFSINGYCSIFWDDTIKPTEDMVRESTDYVIDMTLLWQRKGVVGSHLDLFLQQRVSKHPWHEVRSEKWHYAD